MVSPFGFIHVLPMFIENQTSAPIASCAAIASGSPWSTSYSVTFQCPFESESLIFACTAGSTPAPPGMTGGLYGPQSPSPLLSSSHATRSS